MDKKQALAIIHKTRDNYNLIASHFSQTRAYIWPEFEYFKKFIKDGQNILDWGCGSGRMIISLRGKKVNYFGVDISRNLLAIARKNFKTEIKKGWVKFFCSASHPVKFPNDFFDLELAIASFFHLPDDESRRQTLGKFYRELKIGGKLIISVWNLESDWANFKKKNWKVIGENDYLIPWKNSQGEVLAERYYHHFTKEELYRLLVDSGFKVKRIGFLPSTWSDDKGGRNMIAVAEK